MAPMAVKDAAQSFTSSALAFQHLATSCNCLFRLRSAADSGNWRGVGFDRSNLQDSRKTINMSGWSCGAKPRHGEHLHGCRLSKLQFCSNSKLPRLRVKVDLVLVCCLPEDLTIMHQAGQPIEEALLRSIFCSHITPLRLQSFGVRHIY